MCGTPVFLGTEEMKAAAEAAAEEPAGQGWDHDGEAGLLEPDSAPLSLRQQEDEVTKN